MPRSKRFTTVTTLSKIVALALFVSLPFIGFFYGYSYAANLCRVKYAGFNTKPKTLEAKNEIIIKDFEKNNKQSSVYKIQSESYYFDAGGTDEKGYYSIRIIPGWEVKQEKESVKGKLTGENTVITLGADNLYKVIISQGGFSEAKCIFEDTQILTGVNDIPHSDYRNIVDRDGNSYRRGIPEGDNLVIEGVTAYNVCQYREADENTEIPGYYIPTKSYEIIRYETPNNPDVNMLNQMDQMVESLVERLPGSTESNSEL